MAGAAPAARSLDAVCGSGEGASPRTLPPNTDGPSPVLMSVCCPEMPAVGKNESGEPVLVSEFNDRSK